MAHPLLDDTRGLLGELIGFRSVSQDSNLDLIEFIAARLRQAGAQIEITRDASGTKANVFATIGPNRDGGIVLSGHSDVVPVAGQNWSSDPFAAIERNGRIYGRGSCDMKGFIACAVASAPRFSKLPLTRPLHFAFTYDEEVGCLGAQVMLDALAATGRKPAICIVGEPTNMYIVEGHKGCCEYTTIFTGTDGHASQPDLGVNAIEYAARYIAHLLEISEQLKARQSAGSPFDPPWSTIQVGRITGGVARNIIASSCTLEWELRPINAADFTFALRDIEAYVVTELLPRMRQVAPRASIVTEIIGEVAGLEPMRPSEAEVLVRTLTRDRTAASCVSFGTEAGLFQQHGISTVICGPGSIEQAHKPDEYVATSQLDDCLAMIANLEVQLTR